MDGHISNTLNKKLMMECNNLGVVQLESGRFVEATQCFTAALDFMKSILDQEIHSPSPTTIVGNCSTPTSNSRANQSQACRVRVCAPTANPAIPPNQDHEISLHPASSSPDYVFQSPIYFSEEALINNRLPLANLVLSLLFNLALSHHSIAMQDPTATHSLQPALLHYLLAFSVQVQHGIDLSSIHTLGLINNVSQLLNCMGDKERAQRCFEYLLSSLMLLVDQSRGHLEPPVMRLVERLVQNAACAVLGSSSTAQAA